MSIFISFRGFSQKSWRKLYDSYRKCLRMISDADVSGTGTTKIPKCKYFKELSILKDIMSGRETCSNFPQPMKTQSATLPSGTSQLGLGLQSQLSTSP